MECPVGQPATGREHTVISEEPARRGDAARAIDLDLAPGRVFGLIGPTGSGLTSVGLSLIAAATAREPVAILDGRGWFCPSAAWEAGIAPDRLAVIRCPDRKLWPTVVAALCEGFRAVYAEVPTHMEDRALRRLGALARSRRAGLMLRASNGDLPAGLLHLRLEAMAVRWDGTEQGHGRLERRAVAIRASGKGARGIERYLEVEGDGANALRLVPGLAPAPSGRSTG
jgi:hypothetical protein